MKEDRLRQSTCRKIPETAEQGAFVKAFENSADCGDEARTARVKDCIQGCLMAGYWNRGRSFYNVPQMDEAGAEIARVTHKHPLGFLPAAMLTHLLYQLVSMSAEAVKEKFGQLALETIEALDHIYKDEFTEAK